MRIFERGRYLIVDLKAESLYDNTHYRRSLKNKVIDKKPLSRLDHPFRKRRVICEGTTTQ